MLPPIKIKIGDRDKYMRRQYEEQEARVRQIDGTIVTKNRKDILPTDEVIEYLSNDYIKPLRIRLVDIDIVYATLMKTALIVNFFTSIKEKFTIVYQYGKPRHTLWFFDGVEKTVSCEFAKSVSKVKFLDRIVLALDIFKVEGLKSRTIIKQISKGLQVYYNTLFEKFLISAKIKDAIYTVYNELNEKIKFHTYPINGKTIYYAALEDVDYARIKDIADKTIGELADKTLNFLMTGRPVRFYFRATADTLLYVLQSFKTLLKTKAESSSFVKYYAQSASKVLQKAQVDAVVYTYLTIKDIADDTIGDISDKTIEEITVRYS